MDHRRDRVSLADVSWGIAAGLIGGLAGAFVMNQVSPALQTLKHIEGALTGEASDDASGGEGSGNADGDGGGGSDAAASTVKVAQAAWRTVAGEEMPHDLRATAGNIVHYAFGAASGALYGALAAAAPRMRVGRGALFGAVLWALADETMLPLVGLSKPPRKYPASTHATSLAGHLVYGFTVEVVRGACLDLRTRASGLILSRENPCA